MNTRQRLRRSSDIALVRSRGRRWSNRHLVLCALAGQAERSRVALVVSARVGGAVVRNRIRRRLREAFRPHLNARAAHFDLVAVARAGLRCAPFADVQAAVDDLMRRCTDEHGRVTA